MFTRFNSKTFILAGIGIATILFLVIGLSFFPISKSSMVKISTITSSQSFTAQPATFHNPLNFSGPDPWMTYYDGYYYLAATTWGNSSVGLTMRKASTIVELKDTEPVQIFKDLTPSRCCNYWAPEFYFLNGPNGPRWYGYYSGGPEECCDGQRMHVIESVGTDPLGPYTYKTQLADSIGGWAIDTSIMQLNGSLYLLFSAFPGNDISAITNDQNLYIALMSDPWTLSGDRVLISSPTYIWERQDGRVNEGPVALQHDDKTFIIYSASGCWGPHYKLGILTYNGGDPLMASSWDKSPEPVFQGTSKVFSPGHNNFFKSPDGKEDWIIYHASDSAGGSCDMNRSPRIKKISWKSDGTPYFGSPVNLSVELSIPSE
ncbi:MAG: glycoside hydrolase family 43 protein [Anaerolineales bacterium]|jgi:GH43 family beta-xylosidase